MIFCALCDGFARGVFPGGGLTWGWVIPHGPVKCLAILEFAISN